MDWTSPLWYASYMIVLIGLAGYGSHRLTIVFLYLKHSRKHPEPKELFKDLPLVTIQLPVFNEMHVVDRLLAAVSAMDRCEWGASSGVTWISVASGAKGSGSGSSTFRVAQNTGPTRSGDITVAGQTFKVTQSGAAAGPSGGDDDNDNGGDDNSGKDEEKEKDKE